MLIGMAVAVALLVLIMVAERWIGRRRGVELYSFDDTLLNLASGIGHLVVELAGKSALFGLYVGLYGVWHALDLAAEQPSTWVFGFLVAELAFYIWHRFSHDMSGPWSTHAPHHQSRQFNLSVALRSSWTSKPLKLVVLLPVALVGVPPVVFLAWQVIGFVYQLFIHTKLVGRLPVVEWVFNTPSLHRVHHASNAPYLDKNHGGILIVWDRVFGTFQPELADVPVVYGTVSEEPTQNLIDLQFGPVVRTLRHMTTATTWTEGARRWLASPSECPPPKSPHATTSVPQADRHGLVAALVLIAGFAVALRVGLPDGGLVHLAPLIALAVWGLRLAVLVHPDRAERHGQIRS